MSCTQTDNFEISGIYLRVLLKFVLICSHFVYFYIVTQYSIEQYSIIFYVVFEDAFNQEIEKYLNNFCGLSIISEIFTSIFFCSHHFGGFHFFPRYEQDSNYSIDCQECMSCPCYVQPTTFPPPSLRTNGHPPWRNAEVRNSGSFFLVCATNDLQLRQPLDCHMCFFAIFGPWSQLHGCPKTFVSVCTKMTIVAKLFYSQFYICIFIIVHG